MKGLRVLLMTGLLVAGVVRGMGQDKNPSTLSGDVTEERIHPNPNVTVTECQPNANCAKIGPVVPDDNSLRVNPAISPHPGDCFKLSPSMTLEKIKCPKLTNPMAKKGKPIWADGSPRTESVSGPVPEAPLDPIGIILANEPIDVPAILLGSAQNVWTCADKSRVLETAEDGKHWCRKIQN